jgi:hypothetical protein
MSELPQESESDLPNDTGHGHLVETPDSLRDDDPESLETDRGIEATDRPLGAEKFGTTRSEERDGASLDQRLAEELPEVGAHDPIDDVVADHPDAFLDTTKRNGEPETGDTSEGASDRDDGGNSNDQERAMAVHSADGQVDDATGGAAASARTRPAEQSQQPGGEELHGPV